MNDDFCTWSLDGATVATALKERWLRLPGKQGQEEAQVKCTEEQVRHLDDKEQTYSLGEGASDT